MHSNTGDVRCPVCGQEYDEQVVVSVGVRFRDLYSGSVMDYFRRYERRCSSRVDVSADDGDGDKVGYDEIALYFHDESGPTVSIM